MKTKHSILIVLALALTLPLPTLLIAQPAGVGRTAPPPRPQGPGDISAAAGIPCVAAHSSACALYAAYNGPLYQVMRLMGGCRN